MSRIFFMDDAFLFPANQLDIDTTGCIDRQCLKNMIDEEGWDDADVRSLAEELYSLPEFEVTVFTAPTSFTENTKAFSLSPDILIYDWEYKGTAPEIVIESLNKILENKYCHLFIYTRHDQMHTIEALIKSRFSGYSDRLSILHKEEGDSVAKLLKKITSLRENNFSFRFAQSFREYSSKSVENILVKLAHLDLEKFHQIMGTKGEEKRKDIVEFISEKFKNELMNMDFSIPEIEEVEESGATVTETTEAPDSTNSTSKELWHYRMYSTINDNRVRKGDIYKKSDNEYIMIMTPNCQLVRYHNSKKTLGVFNFVRLISKESAKDVVLEYITIPEGGKLKKPFGNSNGDAPPSLINQIGKDAAPFFLPSVKIIDQTNTLDLLLFPKMFSYEKFTTDEAKTYLEKSNLIENGYSYQTTLSEPFLSELNKEVFDKLQGNGVPDYTQDMISNIKQSLNTTIFS